MTLQERIAQVRAMRAELDTVRDVAPPEEWARFDAALKVIETDMAEVIAIARFAAEKFEKPEVWALELDE